MKINTENIFIIPVIFILLSFSSCNNSDSVKEDSPTVKVLVTLTKPEYNSLSEYMDFNGVTQFQRKDNIRATSTGYISSIYYIPGNYIQSGEIFCLVSTKEQKALEQLSKSDSSLQKFQYPLDVKSNATGIVSEINVLNGDFVNEGEVVAVVLEPGSLVLNLSVPYEFHSLISNRKECKIFLPDGNIINSNISNSLPSVDPKTLAQVFLINLPESNLPENLIVKVRIVVNSRSEVLSLPLNSIQTDEEQKEFWIMKITNDSIAVKVPVLTGLQNDTLIQVISSEITKKDKIVLDGAFGMEDSTLITSGRDQ